MSENEPQPAAEKRPGKAATSERETRRDAAQKRREEADAKREQADADYRKRHERE